MQACICATYKSTTCQPTKAAIFNNTLFKFLSTLMHACKLCALANKHCSSFCSQNEGLFGPHTQARISTSHAAFNAILCCICQRQKSICTLQAEPPSVAEVAHDPRLERVIGAILSGAGNRPSPALPYRLHTSDIWSTACGICFLSKKTQHCFNLSSCLANRTPNKALLVFVCQAGKLCVDSSPPPKPPPPSLPICCASPQMQHTAAVPCLKEHTICLS